MLVGTHWHIHSQQLSTCNHAFACLSDPCTHSSHPPSHSHEDDTSASLSPKSSLTHLAHGQLIMVGTHPLPHCYAMKRLGPCTQVPLLSPCQSSFWAERQRALFIFHLIPYGLWCGASCDSSDILAWKHRCSWCATKQSFWGFRDYAHFKCYKVSVYAVAWGLKAAWSASVVTSVDGPQSTVFHYSFSHSLVSLWWLRAEASTYTYVKPCHKLCELPHGVFIPYWQHQLYWYLMQASALVLSSDCTLYSQRWPQGLQHWVWLDYSYWGCIYGLRIQTLLSAWVHQPDQVKCQTVESVPFA